jgi:dTDP-4-amino-4,6-dideoxygalactose transaminase
MPVYIYGLPVDMDPVRDIARRHDFLVVEDAAEQRVAANFDGKLVIALSDSCSSGSAVSAFWRKLPMCRRLIHGQ